MRLLTILFISILTVIPLMGQTEIRVSEKLPDGSYILKVDDIEYRALPPDKIRQIIKEREQLALIQNYVIQLEAQIENLKRATTEALELKEKQYNVIIEREQKNTEFWKSSFEKEKSLRLKFEGNMKKCWNVGLKICWF